MEDQNDCCPICLDDCAEPANPQQLLIAPPCGHTACRSCFEQMLLVTTPSEATRASNSRTNTSTRSGNNPCIPTLGACPLCRASVYLFDLVDHKSREAVYLKESAIPLPSRLRDAAYVDPLYGIGFGSWHFKDCSKDEQDDQIYFDLSKVERLPGQDPIMPLSVPHFHSLSRTLAGHLLFQSGQYDRWNIYLSFSSDFSFIRAGLIHKVRQRLDDPALVRKRYPLDGLWQVAGSSESIEVEGMIATVRTGYNSFVLRVERQDHAIDLCNVNGTTIARTTFNWTDNPTGPESGDAIVWKMANNPTVSWKVWVRKTVASEVPPDEYMYIGGHSQHTYRRVDMEPRQPPRYNKDSIWGNVFCQGFKIGLASYHFLSPDAGAYISYEHPATGRWPPLDNGAPVPSRVFFRDFHFDGTKFRGRIDWEHDCGTTWQGMAEWVYEIEVDREFTCVVSGTVMSRLAHQPSSQSEMSRYGESLVYINAALYPLFREMARDNSSFAAISQDLRQRLLNEGASVRTLAAVHHVLTASHGDEDDNPIDWNL